MSFVTVHLRWNHVDSERYRRAQRAGSLGDQLPVGCLSRQVRHHGTVLLATEVWDSDEAGDQLDPLVTAIREAGVEEAPQVAMFSVPQMFAVAYRRPSPAASIPAQPGAPSVEQRSETTVTR